MHVQVPEVRLSYKCVFIIYAHHDDLRALLRGSDCDTHRPGVLFIPKSRTRATTPDPTKYHIVVTFLDVPEVR